MLDICQNIVSIGLALLTIYLFVRWTNIFVKKKRYPPGPWGFPIVGHLPFLGGELEKTYLQWWKQYGEVVSFRLGSWKAVIVNGYDAVKDAAERSDDVFSGRPPLLFNKAVTETFGGLKLISFETFSPKFLHLKKIASRALKNYMLNCEYPHEDLFRDEAIKLSNKLLMQGNNEPMQLAFHVELAVESMVYQMFYGKGKEEEIEANVQEVVDAMSYINKFLNADNSVNFMPWLLYLKQGKIEEFKQAILATDKVTKLKAEERIATFEQGQVRDMVDALLAFSNEMPEEENAESFPRSYLIHQRVAFQTAIFDPVCRTILFIILYLTKYPEVQERVNTEISDVIGNDKAVGYKDRDNLPYLNAVILEVMRITSLVPTALPHSALHDTKLRGYDIDKDTMVFFNLHSVSHDKLFWGDPESFRPERLLNEQGHVDKEKCFRILYFGVGRRRCMGEMIAKIIVFITTATLLQRCSFKKAEGCDLDTEPIRGAVYGPKPFKVIVHSK